MKTVVFFNFPVLGHVNPQLNFCKELAKSNVRLLYYTREEYFGKYEGSSKIELRKYPSEFMAYYDRLAKDTTLHSKLLAFLYVFYTLAENILSFAAGEVEREKPDLVICDTLAIWGKVAARKYKIPMAFYFCGLMGDSIAIKKSPAFTMELIKSCILDFGYALRFNSIRKRLVSRYGDIVDKPQDILSHQNLFSIVMTSREFHPGGSEYPKSVKFIGPAWISGNEDVKKEKLIFISIGTIAFSEVFWDRCIQATKGLGYKIIISFGQNAGNKISNAPEDGSVEVYENLSLPEYRKVLARASLFISHGGFNSISDSISFATPLLICPVTSEQLGNGRLIEGYGCGKTLTPGRTTTAKLRAMIEKVLNDDSIPERLGYYAKSFADSMGVQGVVKELIEEFGLLEVSGKS